MQKTTMISANKILWGNQPWTRWKESARVSSDNCCTIIREGEYREMVGYIVANRPGIDDKVLVYLPMTPSKGMMVEVDITEVLREVK